jgi:hypothetical protein
MDESNMAVTNVGSMLLMAHKWLYSDAKGITAIKMISVASKYDLKWHKFKKKLFNYGLDLHSVGVCDGRVWWCWRTPPFCWG